MVLVHQTSRIAIVGAGEVGAAVAFSLIVDPIVGELVLVDVDETKRDGQVQDLSDAMCKGNNRCRIRAGTAKEAGQSDIVVITAGAKQKKGESRLDLLSRNLRVMHDVINSLKPIRPDTVLVLVSNPVDILVYFAQKISGLPKAQVLGSGTCLDSIRLREYLAESSHIAASSINAYVLGEHGDRQFVAWSAVTIGGVPLAQAVHGCVINRNEVAALTRGKAAAIIGAKGATAYGIAGVVSSICASILFDKRDVQPVSSFVDESGCCLSLPVVLGRKGVLERTSFPLDEEESRALEECARALRASIDEAEEKGVYGLRK